MSSAIVTRIRGAARALVRQARRHFPAGLVSVYTITYNEEFMLPFFIAHYRRMFPSCAITVFDNESTDRTVAVAEASGCTVVTYRTGDRLSDAQFLHIKNQCWKTATTEWVLVCDVDELCHITDQDVRRESRGGATILSFEGWDMVNLVDDMAVATITHGVRSPGYDKLYCFNRSAIADINYGIGCHRAAPTGRVRRSSQIYRCCHYKYVNPDYMVSRHAMYAARLSEENQRKGWSHHYRYGEQRIRTEFAQARANAVRVFGGVPDAS